MPIFDRTVDREKLTRDQMLISRTRKVGKGEYRHDFELFSNLQKTPELSANTLDNRRNCRHTHMLGGRVTRSGQ